MTLKDMKIKTFSLIEEYYPSLVGLAEDEDVLNKINGVVNQIQLDLMKLRKINAYTEIEIDEDDSKTINLKETIDDLYQLRSIDVGDGVEYKMPNEDILVLPDNYTGIVKVYYYKYPTECKLTYDEGETISDYDSEFNFDLDLDILEIMPYGIAADLLKMDMISNYGKYFYERYLEMKNAIDSRRTSGMIVIDGGIDV